MYNQIEDILLNISIVIATVWIVKRFWGSFFEEKQNSIPVSYTHLTLPTT